MPAAAALALREAACGRALEAAQAGIAQRLQRADPVGRLAAQRAGGEQVVGGGKVVLERGGVAEVERLKEVIAEIAPDAVSALGEAAPELHTPAPDPQAMGLLMYTSGTTGVPKGVMLTHANLYSNCRSASQWMGKAQDRVGCSWLPPYHDMGLIGFILAPIVWFTLRDSRSGLADGAFDRIAHHVGAGAGELACGLLQVEAFLDECLEQLGALALRTAEGAHAGQPDLLRGFAEGLGQSFG